MAAMLAKVAANRVAALAMKRGNSPAIGSGIWPNKNEQFITKTNRQLIIIAIFECPWLDSNQHYQSCLHNRHRTAIRRVYQLHHTGVS
jgi:hypothetical protein